LAEALVGAGESNAYLRLGWEFDGGWYAWSATTPAAEASYAPTSPDRHRHAGRARGQLQVRLEPDVAAFNDAPYNVALAYPGNAYVNVIGLDAYDQSWVSPQTRPTPGTRPSPPPWPGPCLRGGKRGAPGLPRMGLALRSDGHGLGDDPLFINNMAAWMMTPANDVTYESYFDFDVPGQVDAITDGNFPTAWPLQRRPGLRTRKILGRDRTPPLSESAPLIHLREMLVAWAIGQHASAGFRFRDDRSRSINDVPVSYALVTVVGGVLVSTLSGLVDPGREIPVGATEVHGITTSGHVPKACPSGTQSG